MFITTERQKLLRDSKGAWRMKVLAAKPEDDGSDWEKGTETHTLSSDMAKCPCHANEDVSAHVHTIPTIHTQTHTQK